MIDGKTAFVSDDGDCEKAAKDLLKVLDDDDLKESLRQGGSEIMKDYRLKHLKARIGEFYQLVNDDLVKR